MMTVIGILLVGLVTTVFILMAITPMIAEARPNGTVKRAEIVPIAPPMQREPVTRQVEAA